MLMSNKLLLPLIFLCISAAARADEMAAAIEKSVADDWALSLPGWEYKFPRDHRNHDTFKTEWWYFTGNLRSNTGREFGYQLTFFRQGVRPPSERRPAKSRFVVDHVPFVHFAITDVSNKRFYYDQVITRGAFGEAGFGDSDRLVWIGDSSLELLPEGGFRILGEVDGKSLELELTPKKSPVFHGADGVSQKAAGVGRASHYYSFTRLAANGVIRIGDEQFSVSGTSWYDHEWATNQLTENQVGWDWFSLQFDDGSELMIFQIRTKDGGRGAYSGGTFIRPDGTTVAVRNEDFELIAGKSWKSRKTGAPYPVEWELRIPSLDVELAIAARVADQELVLAPISYWEGSIEARGSVGGAPVEGVGYLEMTGYAGPIVGMQAAIE